MGYGVKLGVDAKVADGISIGAMLQPQDAMDEFDGFKTFLTLVSASTATLHLTLPNDAASAPSLQLARA